MARSIILSNGELGVALDEAGRVRDIYYPHVGEEDHVRGHYIHRLGVWVEGVMSWLGEDESWQISVESCDDALEGVVRAHHERLKIEIVSRDIVYNERPVFLRSVTVTNRSETARDIKLYFSQQFEIYKAHGGDTGYFDPRVNALIHYKGHRVFLIGAEMDGEGFSDYATGLANFAGKVGSHKDAEDGILSKNPIEHGPVDSILGLYAHIEAGASKEVHYWLAAARSIPEAHELNAYIQAKTPEHLARTAHDFWHAWLATNERSFADLSPQHVALFKKSLLCVRAHVDQSGGILASLDSDMLQYGLDTYSYVWPRDAAFAAIALDHAGDTNVAKRFFEFCAKVIEHDGYFMHKYLPDGAIGSSWHPWVKDGAFQLPIQEDETALVVIAAREHFRYSRDLEFLEAMFNPLIEKAADFLVHYRDEETRLPAPSYELWEEHRGISTFTTSSVYGALVAAAELSEVLGKEHHARRYRTAAEEIRNALLTHLWNEKTGTFRKLMTRDSAGVGYDDTIDISSVYGVFAFGVLPPENPLLARAWQGSVRRLSDSITTGGIARYENDEYFRTDPKTPGNPWIVTTLWYAEYLIATARSSHELDRVRDIFDWVHAHAAGSGALAEQLNARTGESVSAQPLTWSHAAYVRAVLLYVERFLILADKK